MNDTVVPIRPASFASRTWKPSLDYRFAAGDALIPVGMEEIGRLTVTFPIAFTAGEVPTPVAVMGLRPGQNLFVAGSDGRWLAASVPAALRRYPFKLLRLERRASFGTHKGRSDTLIEHWNNPKTDSTFRSGSPGEEQFALGYDEASGLLAGAGEGEPFFTADNEPTQHVNETLRFLVRVNHAQQLAARLAGSLAAAGVLEPWPLKIRSGEREIPVNGLLRVAEPALGALADDAFLELRGSGALTLAYAQLFSMANISGLARLAQLQMDRASAARALIERNDTDQGTIDIDAILNGR